jgi:hypothetical protein
MCFTLVRMPPSHNRVNHWWCIFSPPFTLNLICYPVKVTCQWTLCNIGFSFATRFDIWVTFIACAATCWVKFTRTIVPLMDICAVVLWKHTHSPSIFWCIFELLQNAEVIYSCISNKFFWKATTIFLVSGTMTFAICRELFLFCHLLRVIYVGPANVTPTLVHVCIGMVKFYRIWRAWINIL